MFGIYIFRKPILKIFRAANSHIPGSCSLYQNKQEKGEGYEKLRQRKDNGKDNMLSLFKGYLHNETIT